MPINKSYTYLAVLIYSYYFDNVIKVIYGNPRPFWVRPSIFVSCNGGFGNPSGHAFSSSSVYLTIWHLFTDYKWFRETMIGVFTKFILFLLAIGVIIIVIYSRVYLAAHSVNQVLYGGLLGIGLYYTIMFIFSYHSMDAKEFFNTFRNIKNNLIFTACSFIFIIIGFLFWGLINNHTENYEDLLSEICPNVQKYRKFNNNGLFGALSIFGVIGGRYGVVLLVYLVDRTYKNKEVEILNWNKTNYKNNIYKIVVAIIFGIPLLLIFLISNESPMSVIYIFKVSLPYLLGLFNLYGPFIYVSILFKIANNEIYPIELEKKSIIELQNHSLYNKDHNSKNLIFIDNDY
jgi:hypothetical protein